MNKPKRHHYLSQFYLAGFTSNGKKDGDLYCFDLKKKKVRKSKVKEEGHQRNFNKIESDVFDESSLERGLSIFETDAARVFQNIIKAKTLPSTPEDWGFFFYYIALLGVRNPAIRESLDETKSHLMKVSLELLLSDSNVWENYKSKFDDSEIPDIKKMSLFEAREKLLKYELRSLTPPGEFSRIEFPTVDKVTESLSRRKWTLLDASSCPYDFITSDRPVKLFWSNGLNDLGWGPGFGMQNSDLFFPLSKKIYLIGRFENPFPDMTANEKLVSSINTMQIYYTNRFLYGSNDFFYFDDGKNDNVKSSKYFN